MSSTLWPSDFRRDCRPATRSADGPMSTPRRLWPRSIGTPMIRIFCAMFATRSGSPLSPESGENSRIDSVDHTRERNYFADVLSSANPGHCALDSQAKACVWNAAVATKVKIPAKRFLGQIVFPQALQEEVVVCNALAAAYDLAIPLRSQHIKAQCQLGSVAIWLHVKRFHFSGIAMHHHWAVVGAR